MTSSAPENWQPTPELLAAYFDGECEGRDDLSLLKGRIEDWLAVNPQAQEELTSHRRLLHVWHETTPPEPQPEQWASMLAELEALVPAAACQGQPTTKDKVARPRRRLAVALSAAAAVLAGVAIYLGSIAPQNQPASIVQTATLPQPGALRAQIEADEEILPVAHASEVTIVRVEGADTHTLVVGELPLQGLLELVAPGDVILTLIRTDARAEVNPVRLIESSSPMIWAKLESETDD